MKLFSRQAPQYQNPAGTADWEDPHGHLEDRPGAAQYRLTFTNFVRMEMDRDIGADVRQGLSRKQKSLPSKYFYDARGSLLFDEICRLSEYYPTRTEISILKASAPAIMSFFERQAGDLVEIGCGSDLKIRQLLDRIDPVVLRHVRYVPMDISAPCLLNAARRLLADYRNLRIHGLIADFTRHLKAIPAGRKLILFLGGTFGNFTARESIELLVRLATVMGPQDRLIIGLDMLKDKQILEAAYNDAEGVTAAFNLNILCHVNQRLRADFDTAAFAHQAFFDERLERVEMHLRARAAQTVYLADLEMNSSFRRDETIHTEISQKFSRRSAQTRFRKAGLQVEAWHTDPKGWFSLVELRKMRLFDLGYALPGAGWATRAPSSREQREGPHEGAPNSKGS